MSGGRPTIYSPELVAAICGRLADGESLRGICADETMPSKTTVMRWLFDDDKAEFRDQYARAREIQAEALAEELIEIADDGTNDWMERKDQEGAIIGWQLNGEHVQRSRLRVDTRKWAASKLLPKRYGERSVVEGKVEHDHKHAHEHRAVSEIDNRIAELLGTGQAGRSEKARPN